jgi:serine/threonine-protein kinase RsbT
MSQLEQRIAAVLRRYLSEILTHSVLSLSVSWSHVDVLAPTDEGRESLLAELTKGIRLYVQGEERQRECLRSVRAALALSAPPSTPPAEDRLRIPVLQEGDIVVARASGRELCRRLGFSPAAQIKVATAISELARNIVQYAGSGEVVLTALPTDPPGLEIVARDEGPGIASVDHVMSNDYRSRSGMGIGLKGVRKLMDDCRIQSATGRGTVVTARKMRV